MITTWITSKDYLFIKVRYYASDYFLNKLGMEDSKTRVAQSNATMLYLDFYRSFISEFSGHQFSYYEFEYMFGATDASMEEIHELTGIRICCAEGHYIYCIPKTNIGQEMFDWILNNCKCKHTVLKKTRGTYMERGPSRWARDAFKSSDESKIRFQVLNTKN